jgi:hypothetical protein
MLILSEYHTNYIFCDNINVLHHFELFSHHASHPIFFFLLNFLYFLRFKKSHILAK